MNDSETLWKLCSAVVREQVSEATWQAWLAGMAVELVTDTTVVLRAPNALVRDRVESRFLSLVSSALSEVLGRSVSVSISVAA
ncbi:MAG: DnaA N-terminal domain-containing protein, partial [Acidimicrobiales bacterium]